MLFLLLLLTTVSGSTIAHAQTEASDYSRIGFAGFLTSNVTDYQCVGINPANLGFIPQTEIYDLSAPLEPGVEIKKRNVAISVLEGGVSLHSDALDRSGLLDMITQTSSGSFSEEDKFNAAQAFVDNGVRFSIDLIAIAASYQSDSWGGLALSWRERISGTYLFNESASRLAFEGRYFDYFDSLAVNFDGDTVGYATNPQTYSELFDGTRLSTLWFRELGLSYGLNIATINDEVDVYLGVGGKVLFGYAYVDASVIQGALVARSAISPLFGISYGKATTPSFIPGEEFVPVGNGWSMDIGATVTWKELSVGLSVVDIGRIIWNGNVFQAKDTVLNGLSSTGFESFNIFEEAPKITGEGNFFSWDGLGSATSDLPTRLRFGASWVWDHRWTFGLDAIFPFNSAAGALGEPLVTAGADWRPERWLKVGFGIGGGGNMGVFLPVSVLFSVLDNRWEMGIASRDVITYVISDRPILSMVAGIARLRF